MPSWGPIVSGLILVLTVVAAGAGIAAEDVYRDNLLVRSGWLGNDLATLCLSVPALAFSTWWARRGSRRAHLVWLGVLLAQLYNFAFYLFGSAFNSLFLVYTLLVALSGCAFVGGLVALDPADVTRHLERPRRWVAIWLGLVALLLGGFWVGLTVVGPVQDLLQAIGHPTNVIAALDLTLVVPLHALAAVLLLRNRPFGVPLAVVANVQGAIYMPALSASTWTAWLAGASTELWQIGLWSTIFVGSTAATLDLLRSAPRHRTNT
jgi:hypothetical protein